MAILTANGLSKFFGAQDVLSGISFEINHGDKVAMIGPNGVGKTTLLRILCGLETPSAGSVSKAKNLRIGYLPQQASFTSEQTLYDEMLAVFCHLQAQREALHTMEAEISQNATCGELLERYGKAVERFDTAGGYEYESRIQRTLGGLGFRKEDFGKPISILSGGQKTRALLTKLLLQDPEFLLLDEPTNHLDLAATEWLEKYLQDWPESLVVVSHDRYFLDRVVNRVLELDLRRIEEYRGNYTAYSQQHTERQERRLKEYTEQREQIAVTEEFIRRYKAGQRSKEARGRLKRLERVDLLERPQEQKTLHLSLHSSFRSGNDVLVGQNLEIGYPPAEEGGRANTLFSCPKLLLRRQQRVALLGPNGVGKTTFLKTVLDQVPPLSGTLRVGSNVQVGYFAQGHEDLNPDNSLLEEILTVKNLPIAEARNFLARFLFAGDDVFKPIASLSGGERGRVALAKLTMKGANLLLLDEPTNHLDIAAQETLERVLLSFDGTILFVSHDRYFIDAIATHLWVIEDGVLRAYEGNYSAYTQQQAPLDEMKSATEPIRRLPPRKEARVREPRPARMPNGQQVAQLEASIGELEARLRALEEDLAIASMAQRVDRIRELGTTYAAVERELYDRLAAWTEAEHEAV
jgi:ATP-binding cassette subfamily F protein 3